MASSRARVLVGGGIGQVVFEPGSEHTAHLTFTNPTAWDWVYAASLRINGISMGGPMGLAIAAGQSVNFDILVTMPSTEGIYPVTVQVWEAPSEVFLGEFPFGDIIIVIPAAPDISVGLTWD